MATTRDKIRFWKDTQLPDGLDVLRASCFDLRYPAHFHEEFVIAAFSRGAQRHRIARLEGVAAAGTLMIIPPGEVHTGQAVERTEGWDYCSFYPSARFIERIADDVLGGQGHVDFGRDLLRHDPVMTGRLLDASTVLATSPDVLERECTAFEIFGAVISRYGERRTKQNQTWHLGADMRAAMEFLQDNFSKAITMKSVAGIVGLSEYHFMRTFRAKTGLSAHQYLTQIRIERAKDLLAKNLPAAEIALSVGFFDQSHFINRFRAHFGVTPGSYATACR